MATNIPREVLDYYSAKVLNQITEGLVGFNPETLKIEPRLAESWNKSDDGTKYTFKLRNDVYFHPHELFSGKEEHTEVPSVLSYPHQKRYKLKNQKP